MKLNIGSGNKLLLKDYVNVDASFGRMAYPLDCPDDSADEIYASHILEHFSHHETLNVLKDWVRALKPGGWLKIAVPDFDWIWEQRYDALESGKTRASLPQLQGYLMGGQVDENDFHKAIFTRGNLTDLLADAGLINIQGWTSEVKDCASLPVSLNLTGQKPEAKTQNEAWRRIEEIATEQDRQNALNLWNDGAPESLKKPRAVEPPLGRLKQLHQMYEGQAHCFKCGKPSSQWLNTAEECEGNKPTQPRVPDSSLGELIRQENTTPVNVSVEEFEKAKDDILARRASIPRMQVFASGRWQDMSGEVQCATQEELEAAQRGELQTRTIVSEGSRKAEVALCLSMPRVGFLRPLERMISLAGQLGLGVFNGDGVFWHHALSRSIKNAVECYFPETGEGFDYILTADYDTFAQPEDIFALVSLLARNPQVDCIVPLQMKRGGTGEVLAQGQNMNLTHELVPIETGHFGLTLFRREFFERLPKPWFTEKPDAEGFWGEGRIDADIGFWLNAKKAKLNVMLAPGIVVGHGEELITYPRIVNGKPQKVYQAVNDWLSGQGKPEGIGAQ